MRDQARSKLTEHATLGVFFTFALLVRLLCSNFTSDVSAAEFRLVVIDQDASGPGGSNQMGMMALLQAEQVKVLGITIVTGDSWRDEEVQHTLRMLELIGRSDVFVVPGAVYPLVRTREETMLDLKLYGKLAWLGVWGGEALDKAQRVPEPDNIPPLPEGMPTTKPLGEDAAHFLLRMVREHPHQVTIYAGGPMTNLALAQRIDPQFAALAKELVFMGGSLNPITEDPEFSTSPRHEFNFWFDPEAARIVLRAPWKRIICTTVDVSLKTYFTQEMLDEISKFSTPAAQYITHYSQRRYYMWDEIAAIAWLNPEIITKEQIVYMDVNLDHGPAYGHTLTWTSKLKPEIQLQQVHAQTDLDLPKFNRKFVELMTVPPHKP
jgi:inosine-uridine nucleoside N-ribohydrolase